MTWVPAAFWCADDWQPDGGDQVGHGGDLTPRGWVGAVHRVVAGEHGGDAAWAGEREALDDEVVVKAVSAGVVGLVVQRDVAERDVADDQVEVVAREPAVGERLVADLRVRVQVLRDRRGGRVELDAEHCGVLLARCVWGEAEEGASAAAGFEHPQRPPLDPEAALGQRRPTWPGRGRRRCSAR